MWFKIKLSIFLIIILIFQLLGAQSWKKSLKSLETKVAKEIKEQVKPITVDFKVTNIGYNPLKSLNKLNLTIDFLCENPNPIGITFNRTEFDLFVNDKLLSKFHNEKGIKVPKNDKFTFQELAEVNILEAGKVLFNSIRKKEAVYKLRGKYFVDTSLGTYAFEIDLLEKIVNEKEDK